MNGSTDWLNWARRQFGVARRVCAGASVFRQADPATAVYVVGKGRVRLTRHLRDGSSVVVYVARSGEAFAEAALFASYYHCDAVAEVDSDLVMIPKRSLRELVERDASISLQLAQALASRVIDLRARLELRDIRSAEERLLAWLRLRADGGPASMEMDRPWTAIASELGLSHETVYRALAALVQKGKIIRRGNAVRLLTNT